jgi:hypothetical protein
MSRRNITWTDEYAEKIRRRIVDNVAKDEVSGCWIWQGCRDEDEYGVIAVRNVACRAPRVSAALFNGFDIGSDRIIRHICDNPPCVNPEHLMDGTWADNMRDKIARGRANPAWGEAKSTKLSLSDVRKIRKLKSAGMTGKELGIRFGISEMHANAVARGTYWRRAI